MLVTPGQGNCDVPTIISRWYNENVLTIAFYADGFQLMKGIYYHRSRRSGKIGHLPFFHYWIYGRFVRWEQCRVICYAPVKEMPNSSISYWNLFPRRIIGAHRHPSHRLVPGCTGVNSCTGKWNREICLMVPVLWYERTAISRWWNINILRWNVIRW